MNITEEKIAAVERAINDYEQNLVAINAANIDKGYEIMLIEAAYTALKQKLVVIFT